jgi:Holliday junction DNA helicase RuvA
MKCLELNEVLYMIAFIKGKIEEFGEEYVIIDNNGIGYLISMPSTEINKIKNNKDVVKIHTYQHVREDFIGLFGFLDNEKLHMFKMLLNVSGVGPKAALSIISSIEPQNMILAIITSDEKTLCKAQGVGKKLAQRIILELKDKFKSYDFLEQGSSTVVENVCEESEAIGALMALGYTRQEALGAIRKVDVDKAKGIEEVVKLALKSLMRG